MRLEKQPLKDEIEKACQNGSCRDCDEPGDEDIAYDLEVDRVDIATRIHIEVGTDARRIEIVAERRHGGSAL